MQFVPLALKVFKELIQSVTVRGSFIKQVLRFLWQFPVWNRKINALFLRLPGKLPVPPPVSGFGPRLDSTLLETAVLIRDNVLI